MMCKLVHTLAVKEGAKLSIANLVCDLLVTAFTHQYWPDQFS